MANLCTVWATFLLAMASATSHLAMAFPAQDTGPGAHMMELSPEESELEQLRQVLRNQQLGQFYYGNNVLGNEAADQPYDLAQYDPEMEQMQPSMRPGGVPRSRVKEPISMRPEEVYEWPAEYVTLDLGQVGGLSIDDDLNCHVFHRANRIWDKNTFDEKGEFRPRSEGPIKDATILVLDERDGKVLNSLGSNRFYLPHGMSLDEEGNYWLTDVAMHQVFKYSAMEDKPLLVLGKEFEAAESNADKERFCKPTDVAVAPNGNVFVADGYCNSRVVVFASNGTYLTQFGEDNFLVPHSLTLLEDLDLLCVADRDDGRVLCYNAGLDEPSALGQPERIYDNPELGRVFAISYSIEDSRLFAVSSTDNPSVPYRAFTINMEKTYDEGDRYEIDDEWTPRDPSGRLQLDFSLPHDVDVSSNGTMLYVGLIDHSVPKKVWKFATLE